MTKRHIALLTLTAFPLLAACGGGGGTDAGRTDSGGASACSGIVDDNHGHAVSVPRADVEAGGTYTYDIRGTASHTHTITLSPAEFAVIDDVGMVLVTSTLAGHSHMVTIDCR